MNTATRTIQDEWLLSYAAGALSPGRSLMVAAHTDYHDQLQEKLADAEAIGGAILEAANPADIDEQQLERLLDRIDAQPFEAERSSAIRSRVLPAALADFVGGDIDTLKWRAMGPGMGYVKLTDNAADEQLWLLRARGGVQIPEHGHSGEEWTLVLKGSYQDVTGSYARGDISLLADETEHQPIIDEDEECVCLVLTQQPLRFKGAIPKIAQAFIGL